MWVPLTEPRSSIVGRPSPSAIISLGRPSPSEMIAWRRETSSSVRWTAAVGSRPITDCAVRENERPLSGPSTTKSSISELGVDPVHRCAQLLADRFDLVLLLLLAHALEVLLAGTVLRDPLLGELAGLDLTEDLLHRLAGGI